MKILITCGGGFQGLTLVKNIKKWNPYSNIYVADIYEDNITRYFCDNFIKVPPVSDEKAYTYALKNLCKEYGINYIIPSTPIDLKILSKLKTKFREIYNTFILVPEYEIVETFLNKAKTYTFLKFHNLPVLPTFKLDNPPPSFPIILKPNTGSGSKNIIKIFNESDYKKIQNELHVESYIAQPLIENFEEFSIDFSISMEGLASDFIVRQRIMTSLGFATVMKVVFPNKEVSLLINSLRNTFSKPAFVGIYNLQIILDKSSGELFISDVNPRIGTSAIASLFLDTNLLDNLFGCQISKVTNETCQSKKATQELKIVRFLSEKKIPLKKNKIRNIIIDLDNTIVNTLKFTFERCSLLYDHIQSKINIPKITFLMDCINIIINGQIQNLIDIISTKHNLDKKEHLTIYRKNLPPVEVFDDAIKFLTTMKKKEKKIILLTIGSNSETHHHKLKNLKNFFDQILIVKEKYDPYTNFNSFKEVLINYNLNPEETISIGDNFFSDIYPSWLAKYKMIFYIIRKNSYLPVFDSRLLFDRVPSNIYEIETFDEIFNYIE